MNTTDTVTGDADGADPPDTAPDDGEASVAGDEAADRDGPPARADSPGPGVSRRPLPPWLLPAAVVAVVVALPLWGMWIAPGPPMEEGFMLVFPERVLAGDVPNRDFLHLYGPGSLWVLAGTFQVLGVDLWVERLVGLAQIVGLVAGVTVANYRWGRAAALIGGVTTALIIMPAIGLTALAWVGGLALGLWACLVAGRAVDARTAAAHPATDDTTTKDTATEATATEATATDDEGDGRPTGAADDRRTRRLLVVAGLLGGFSLLYRPDLIVAVGLPFLVLWLWGLDGRGRKLLLGASIAGVSPILVHLAMAGPGNAITGMVIQPVLDLRGGRTLNFPPPWNEYESFLNKAFLLRDWPWPFPRPDGPNQVVLWTILLFACCALLAVVAIRARRHRLAGHWTVLALALFAVGTLPQAVQRPDTAHLAWVSAVPFGLWPLAEAVRRQLRSGTGRPRRAVPLLATQALVPVAVMMAVIPTFTVAWYADYVGQTFGYNREGNRIEHRDRVFYHGRLPAARAAREMLDDVEEVTRPGDRLIVGTLGGPRGESDTPFEFTPYSEVQFYFLLPQLEPGTHYIEMDPGVANTDDSGLADEVRDADVIILSSLYDDWTEPNESAEPGSAEPAEALAEGFCLHGSYGRDTLDRPLYELHVRC